MRHSGLLQHFLDPNTWAGNRDQCKCVLWLWAAHGKKLMITKLSWNIESLTFFPASKILCCWHWHRWHSHDRQHTEQRKHPRYAWRWVAKASHTSSWQTLVLPLSSLLCDLVSILISLDAAEEDLSCNITWITLGNTHEVLEPSQT